MKTFIFIMLLSVTFSGVAFGWQPYQDKSKGKYSSGLPNPSQTQAPAYVTPQYKRGWSQPGARQGRRPGQGHIYVTPDLDTQRRDLRDQRSLMSPEPNPFANDPRNPFQGYQRPRGYNTQW